MRFLTTSAVLIALVVLFSVTFRTAGPPSDRRYQLHAANTTPSYFVYDSLPHEHLLNSSFAPNVVYYVWCGRRWFEFKHYLSVMSVVRLLRPDSIVFLYDSEPVVDSSGYNTWYSEISDSYPFFRRHELHANQPGCARDSPNVTFVRHLLYSTGGMYVNEHTILSRYSLDLRLKDLVVGFGPKSDPTSSDDDTPALLATKPAALPGEVKLSFFNFHEFRIKLTKNFTCRF